MRIIYLYCGNTASVDTVSFVDNEGATASAAAATIATASSTTASTTAASSALPRILSSEAYSSPQLAALRNLVSLQLCVVFISNVLMCTIIIKATCSVWLRYRNFFFASSVGSLSELNNSN